MATSILTREYMEPRPDATELGGKSWYVDRPGERRIIVALHRDFFKINGNSYRSCVRDVINDAFNTKVGRVYRGLLMVWTLYKTDIAQLMNTEDRKHTILSADMAQGRDLIRILEWVTSHSLYMQRRFRYDIEARCCVGHRTDAGRTRLLRSPKLRRRTYWKSSGRTDGDGNIRF